MISQREQQQKHVKLFVRADTELGCETQKQSVLDRLDDLESDDQFDSYEVHVWASEIRPAGPLRSTPYYQTIFTHLSDFQEWAEEASVSLDFAFKRKTLSCEITGETYSVLSLPSMCLAVYEGPTLSGVYPHSTNDTLRTISGYLSQVESEPSEKNSAEKNSSETNRVSDSQ